MLVGRRIVLGVTGGVAAFKSAYLARRLVEQGAEVKVIMTRSSLEFLGPQTMAAITGSPPFTELFGTDRVSPHTELAAWAEVVVIAPATAATLSRMANGESDDLLVATLLAFTGPVVVAPAMHTEMWEHPATRRNLNVLADDGVRIVGPGRGALAGGDEGTGRMVEPEEIVEAITAALGGGDLAGLKVLVSAGGTREPVDPVRFIGNRSSGKMGNAVALAAARRGATVTLVTTTAAATPGYHRDPGRDVTADGRGRVVGGSGSGHCRSRCGGGRFPTRSPGIEETAQSRRSASDRPRTDTRHPRRGRGDEAASLHRGIRRRDRRRHRCRRQDGTEGCRRPGRQRRDRPRSGLRYGYEHRHGVHGCGERGGVADAVEGGDRRSVVGPRAPGQVTLSGVARVVPDVPSFAVDDGFVYAVPDGMSLSVGSMVRVPLGGRRVRGWVVALGEPDRPRLRAILSRSGDIPTFDARLLGVLRWAAIHYVAPLAAVLAKASPPNIPRGSAGGAALPGVRRRPRLLVGADPWEDTLAEEAGAVLGSGRSVVVVAATIPEADHLALTLGKRLREPVTAVSSQMGGAAVTASGSGQPLSREHSSWAPEKWPHGRSPHPAWQSSRVRAVVA